MKKNFKTFKYFALSAFAILSLASCGGESAPHEEPPVQPDTPQKEEFGITQRENDLDDYPDLRPDREGFVDNTEPDTGTLVDHIYEFEKLASNSHSRERDHMCSATSYVVSSGFSGNVAVECVDIGASFTLVVESDKAVKVPLVIGLNNNNIGGMALSNVLEIVNNNKFVADGTVTLPTEGTPAEGAPEGYFDMVQVETTISLEKGKNRINFKLLRNEINLDFVNLKTSATIVNKTVSAWDIPNYEVLAEPTEKQSGTLLIKCGKEDCHHVNKTRYLPKLTDECYKVTEKDHIKTYTINLAGQDVIASTIDTNPQTAYPQDDGKKVDHIYEFEQANITGPSQNEDHFCGAKSLVFSGDFSNNFCLEAIDAGTKLSFTINSSDKVEVPFDIRLSSTYCGGAKLSDKFIVKVNGDSKRANLDSTIPWGKGNANVGPVLSQYFSMSDATGTLKLSQGKNTIDIIPKETGMNVDFLNIKTSKTLENNTDPYWKDKFIPTLEVKKAPEMFKPGEVIIKCPTGTGENCVRTYDYISPLYNKDDYIVEKVGDKTNYSVEAFGKKYLIASIKDDANVDYPLDDQNTKDNIFEFENSSVTGHSQFIEDHFYASEALVYSSGFSNNFCLENTGKDTVFSFNINSSKKVKVFFEISLSRDISGGKPLQDTVVVKNNGDPKKCITSFMVPSDGPAPDVGDLSQYFHMVKATGTVDLEKGDNKIEISPNQTGINFDYLNIKTTATLVNNTKSLWNETNKPTVKIIKAPTTTSKGTMTLHCPKEGCKKGDRTYNYLPKLNDKDYTLESDGYYLNIFGEKVKVANKA